MAEISDKIINIVFINAPASNSFSSPLGCSYSPTAKVDFNISEAHLASVAVGQTVYATSVAYPGETFSGAISSIDARLDPVTRSIQVRAIIDNQENKLRPGMLLQITVQRPKNPQVKVDGKQ